MQSLRETFRTATSMLFLALIVIGVTGLSWDTFRDGGWFEQSVGSLWDAGTRNPLLITSVVIGTLFAARAFLQGTLKPGKGRASAAVLITLFVGAGLYYSFRWFII